MSERNGGEAAEDQGQMKDQEAFREDPRGKQEVAEQQPETQPGGGDAADKPSDEQGRASRRDRSRRLRSGHRQP